MRQKPLRVLIVEDDILVCEMIRGMVRQLCHDIVGRARDGAEAVRLTCDLKPDVVLMDIELPGCSGIEAARQIQRDCPTPVVALTAYSEAEIVAEASAAGMGSYLLKPPNVQEIERAIIISRARFEDMVALRKLNAELQAEIAERARVEAALRELNDRLEACVSVRTQELAAANNDLQHFVYAASHDLKTPVRGMAQLAYLLNQDYGEHFDDEGCQMLDLLMSRARRLDRLLNAILEYAWISRSAWADEPVDLRAVLADIIERLASPPSVEIRIPADLPVIAGNRELVRQIFYHLLENALRFLETPAGVITVTSAEDDVSWTFAVRDTGPGIAARYQTEIFGIFRTLGKSGTRENPGVGLAIVKKAVEIAGGSVSIDSAPGRGSTFAVRLPKSGTRRETDAESSAGGAMRTDPAEHAGA